MDRFKIAVIDDESIVCREIKRGLSKEGYAVEIFGDAESGLKAFEREAFDLVLCDLRLPGLGGQDVLKHIRTHYPHTEVILITGYGSVDSAIEAIRAGAFHYVAKPVKMAEIRLLAKRLGAQVYILQQVASTEPADPLGSTLEEALLDLINSAREAGLSLSHHVATRDLKEEIVGMAREEGIDLLVFEADDEIGRRLLGQVKPLVASQIIQVKEKTVSDCLIGEAPQEAYGIEIGHV